MADLRDFISSSELLYRSTSPCTASAIAGNGLRKKQLMKRRREGGGGGVYTCLGVAAKTYPNPGGRKSVAVEMPRRERGEDRPPKLTR